MPRRPRERPERQEPERREEVSHETEITRAQLDRARAEVWERIPKEQREKLKRAWYKSGFPQGFVPVRLFVEGSGNSTAGFLFNNFQSSSKAFNHIKAGAAQARKDARFSTKMSSWIKKSPSNAKNWFLEKISPSYWLPTDNSIWVKSASSLSNIVTGTLGWVFAPRSRFKTSRMGKWVTERRIARATDFWSSGSRQLLEEYERNPGMNLEQLREKKIELDIGILKAYGIKDAAKMAERINYGREYQHAVRETPREFSETGGQEPQVGEEMQQGEDQRMEQQRPIEPAPEPGQPEREQGEEGEEENEGEELRPAA